MALPTNKWHLTRHLVRRFHERIGPRRLAGIKALLYESVMPSKRTRRAIRTVWLELRRKGDPFKTGFVYWWNESEDILFVTKPIAAGEYTVLTCWKVSRLDCQKEPGQRENSQWVKW